ncbi:kinase-like domain-containing protein [Rhizophagus clarus]|uniref:Kinase-like domain-containing protein n=1 Tax=Rhizophagus clarus TaxID=94130 RepID=A0A8H3LSB4_9GLOM|nr:kinase-like domain-containing protein [Rhizophagus clarus]
MKYRSYIILNCKNIKIIDIIRNSPKIKWIPHNQFNDIKEIGKNGFSTVYSAIWDNKQVALKCLHNSQNFIYEFLNEVEVYLAYTNQKFGDILNMYGISQNPDSKEFIIVLEYAKGGTFNDYLYRNYKTFDWLNNIRILITIIKGLKGIHQKQMVHCDFHPGNILFKYIKYISICISDFGLCGEVATGRQPFYDRAHDLFLALDICNGVRPEINESNAPKCYINLMKQCWDSNPNHRPTAVKIEEYLWLFFNSTTLNASEFNFL